MEFSDTYKHSGPCTFSPDSRFLAVAVDSRLVIRDVVSLKVCSPHPPPPLFFPPVLSLSLSHHCIGSLECIVVLVSFNKHSSRPKQVFLPKTKPASFLPMPKALGSRMSSSETCADEVYNWNLILSPWNTMHHMT